MPEGPGGTGTEVVTDSTGIARGTPDVKAATTFLDWLTSEEEVLHQNVKYVQLPEGPHVAEDERMKNDTFAQTFVDMSQAANAVPQPGPALWEPFQKVVIEMVQSVLIGDATPQEAAKKAAGEIRRQKLEPR